jgi:hypothetical protein
MMMSETQSEGSLRRQELLLLGASAILGAAVILSNPVAVGLPIAGTISVVTMMSSIDRMYARFSPPAEPTADGTPSGSA